MSASVPFTSVLRGMVFRPGDDLANLGDQLSFYASSIRWTPRTLARYKQETVRQISDVAFGVGGLAVVGGTVGIMAFLAFLVGTEVGLQGYSGLQQLGAANFTAFLSAYFNTREAAPLVAGIALAATVGCGFTAQLGAMRINEEVDALEAMAVPSMPYLVTTRMIAGFVTVIPLYAIGLFSSYFASRTITVYFFGQSSGTYDHYFSQYLSPVDVLWSFGKVVVFAIAIVLIHCYYGYTASGGPAGVGMAVGRAIRASIVAVTVSDFFFSLAVWGATTTVRITG